LNSRWQASLFLAIIAVAGFLFIGDTVRIVVADRWSQSASIADVSRATRLDPNNPEFQRRLGLLYEYDWQQINAEEAVFHLKAATARQPNRASYWVELGRACYMLSDDTCADWAFENAVRLAPTVPRYQWEIANHYLVTGRRNQSLTRFSRFLELNPNDPIPTFRLCLRAFQDPKMIWAKLLPNTPDTKLRLAFIAFLNENDLVGWADRFWDEIAASGSQVSFAAVKPYLERLIAANRIVQASRVWQDLARLGVIHKSSDSGNSIFNGDFEQPPLNAGFDWHYQFQEYVAYNFGDSDCRGNDRCLHIDFTVARNADYEPIYQIVPVTPNQQYLLTCFARSEELTSDSGPRLRVLDPECPDCLSKETQSTVGTTSWHKLSLTFTTPERTLAVRISVWRPRARAFPTEIQGQFWLDSVSLKAVSQAPNSE